MERFWTSHGDQIPKKTSTKLHKRLVEKHQTKCSSETDDLGGTNFDMLANIKE